MLTDANVCEDCEVGWYQPDKWQEICIQCEDQRTTNDVGSTSIDQCSCKYQAIVVMCRKTEELSSYVDK